MKPLNHTGITGGAAVFIVLTLILTGVYSGSLGGEYISDDIDFIGQNHRIRGETNILNFFTHSYWFYSARARAKADSYYYRPLILLSFYLDYRIHGGKPWGFRLTNILLTALLSLVFIQFLCRVLGTNREIAFLAGLIMALHPVHATNIRWVVGRNEILPILFGLAFLTAGSAYIRRGTFPRLLAALLLLVLGLLSKESFILFLPILLVLHHTLLRGSPSRGLLYLFCTLSVLGYLFLRSFFVTSYPLASGPITGKILRVLSTTGFFLVNTLFPFYHRSVYEVSHTWSPLYFVAGCLFLSLWLMMLYRTWKRERYGHFFLWVFTGLAVLFMSAISLLESYLIHLRFMSIVIPPLTALAILAIPWRSRKIRLFSLLTLSVLFSLQILFDNRVHASRESYYRHLMIRNPRSFSTAISYAEVLQGNHSYSRLLTLLDRSWFHEAREERDRQLRIHLLLSRMARNTAHYRGAADHLAKARKLADTREEHFHILLQSVDLAIRRQRFPRSGSLLQKGAKTGVPSHILMRKAWQIHVTRLDWENARKVEKEIRNRFHIDLDPSTDSMKSQLTRAVNTREKLNLLTAIFSYPRAIDLLKEKKEEFGSLEYHLRLTELLLRAGHPEPARNAEEILFSPLRQSREYRVIARFFTHRIYRPRIALRSLKALQEKQTGRNSAVQKDIETLDRNVRRMNRFFSQEGHHESPVQPSDQME